MENSDPLFQNYYPVDDLDTLPVPTLLQSAGGNNNANPALQQYHNYMLVQQPQQQQPNYVQQPLNLNFYGGYGIQNPQNAPMQPQINPLSNALSQQVQQQVFATPQQLQVLQHSNPQAMSPFPALNMQQMQQLQQHLQQQQLISQPPPSPVPSQAFYAQVKKRPVMEQSPQTPLLNASPLVNQMAQMVSNTFDCCFMDNHRNNPVHNDSIFRVKRKCFRTLHGSLVEPKCSIQVHIEKPEVLITRITCKTKVKEQKKEAKKKKSSKSKNQIHQKDYSLTMTFDFDTDSEEPAAKRLKRDEPSVKIAVVDKTLVFRYKLRDRPITEEKVAKNVENPIVMKKGQLSILDYFEVPHMLTACLPATIEVEIYYKFSLEGEEYHYAMPDFQDETFIFLSRVPDIAQVQKYFNSLLKSQGKTSINFVEEWLIDIMKNYYNLDLTDAQVQYILKDLTLNERDHMLQFGGNIYQFQQCLQYTSKHSVPALKFIWENKMILFISFEDVKQRLEKNRDVIYLRWVGGGSEKQLKKENNMYGCIYMHFMDIDGRYETITFYPNRSKSFEDQIQEYLDKFKILSNGNYYLYMPLDNSKKKFSEIFPLPSAQPVIQPSFDSKSDVTPVDAVKEAIVRINKN